MKKTSIALVMAATLGLSTAAVAGSVESQGFYAGGNLGYSSMDIYGNWDDTTGLGYNVHGGYMFNTHWGAEVGYTHFADATRTGETYKAYSVDMAAKGVYHFDYQWSGFAKAGFGNLHGEDNNNSKTRLKPLVGIGAGYNANHNVTVNAGYSYIMGGDGQNDLGNNSLLYVGVDYHF